jgi:hypothetical protein
MLITAPGDRWEEISVSTREYEELFSVFRVYLHTITDKELRLTRYLVS